MSLLLACALKARDIGAPYSLLVRLFPGHIVMAVQMVRDGDGKPWRWGNTNPTEGGST